MIGEVKRVREIGFFTEDEVFKCPVCDKEINFDIVNVKMGEKYYHWKCHKGVE